MIFPQFDLSRLDHFHILFKSSKVKWDSTPFRFENMWLQYSSFWNQVKAWLEKCFVTSWEGFKCMKKLKFVNKKLNIWNRDILET